MRSFVTALVVLLVACGGDDDGGGTNVDAAVTADAPASIDAPPTASCGTPGTVTGTVMGEMIAPVMRAQQLTLQQGVVILLDEVAGACNQNSTTGEHLVLIFCAAPTAGTYPVVGEQVFMCPGNNSFGLVEQNGSQDFAESVGGTVTISAVTSSCVTGTFTINYPNAEQLTGSFNAEICP